MHSTGRNVGLLAACQTMLMANNATLTLPTYIATEAVLSYLGVGVLPPTPSFGAILADSVQYMAIIPSNLLIPGIVLAIVVVTFNLVGDSVRDALDPRAGRS